MIVLDTNICIAFLNNHPGVVGRITRAVHGGEVIAVPAVVAAEFFYGAYKSARVTENVRRLRKFFRGVNVLSFNFAAARTAGRVKSELDRLGRPTGGADLLIATAALRHDGTLVINNARHFENIPNLKLDDWLR